MMVLWLLLGAATVMAFSTLGLIGPNLAAYKDIRDVQRRHGVTGTPMAIALALSALAMAVLWTIYAVQHGEWQIGAVAWLPICAGWISRIAASGQNKGGAS